MNVRTALCAVAAVTVLAACGSSGTDGKFVPGPGATDAVAGGGSASVPAVSAGGGSASVPADSSGGGTGAAAFCGKLTAAEQKLAGLSESASDPSALSSVIDQQIAAYKSLEDGAPADVRPAIEDLVNVLTVAKTGFSDPTHIDPSALQGLSSKLPKDAQTIGTYLAKNCAGH